MDGGKEEATRVLNIEGIVKALHDFSSAMDIARLGFSGLGNIMASNANQGNQPNIPFRTSVLDFSNPNPNSPVTIPVSIKFTNKNNGFLDSIREIRVFSHIDLRYPGGYALRGQFVHASNINDQIDGLISTNVQNSVYMLFVLNVRFTPVVSALRPVFILAKVMPGVSQKISFGVKNPDKKYDDPAYGATEYIDHSSGIDVITGTIIDTDLKNLELIMELDERSKELIDKGSERFALAGKARDYFSYCNPSISLSTERLVNLQKNYYYYIALKLFATSTINLIVSGPNHQAQKNNVRMVGDEISEKITKNNENIALNNLGEMIAQPPLRIEFAPSGGVVDATPDVPDAGDIPEKVPGNNIVENFIARTKANRIVVSKNVSNLNEQEYAQLKATLTEQIRKEIENETIDKTQKKYIDKMNRDFRSYLLNPNFIATINAARLEQLEFLVEKYKEGFERSFAQEYPDIECPILPEGFAYAIIVNGIIFIQIAGEGSRLHFLPALLTYVERFDEDYEDYEGLLALIKDQMGRLGNIFSFYETTLAILKQKRDYYDGRDGVDRK